MTKYSKQFSLNLKKTGLLVIDMQNYFLSKASDAFLEDAANIIAPIKRLIEKAETTIFTRHIDKEDDNDIMFRWWGMRILEKDKLSEIISDFDNKAGKIIKKNRYSAFYNTELEEFLKKKGIEQIIITGVMTHLCCETTARDAFMRGFDVFFVTDATATNSDEFHQATIRAISHGFGVCKSTEEILECLKK